MVKKSVSQSLQGSGWAVKEAQSLLFIQASANLSEPWKKLIQNILQDFHFRIKASPHSQSADADN